MISAKCLEDITQDRKIDRGRRLTLQAQAISDLPPVRVSSDSCAYNSISRSYSSCSIFPTTINGRREVKVNTSQYARLLSLLLEGSVIANFEYWSEFILRIQRDEAATHPALRQMFGSLRIPPLFCLRLRGTWWIGQRQDWELAVQRFPLKGTSPIAPEAPMQAAILITELGKQISALRVGENCDLTLDISDGSSIVVQGTGGGWDEAWILEPPADDPELDKWQIVCESQGLIGGKIPL